MADDDLDFDFEGTLAKEAETYQGASAGPGGPVPTIAPGTQLGQSLTNFKKNFRQTVCTYWVKGLCMKGDACGFLHQFDPERMPTCRAMLRHGTCRDADCPYKHTLDDVKECNAYRLGLCVYGPTCRYRHTRLPGPPPDPMSMEAARPRAWRNVNAVVNSVNTAITASKTERARILALAAKPDKGEEGGGGGGGPLALTERAHGAAGPAALPGVPQQVQQQHAPPPPAWPQHPPQAGWGGPPPPPPPPPPPQNWPPPPPQQQHQQRPPGQ